MKAVRIICSLECKILLYRFLFAFCLVSRTFSPGISSPNWRPLTSQQYVAPFPGSKGWCSALIMLGPPLPSPSPEALLLCTAVPSLQPTQSMSLDACMCFLIWPDLTISEKMPSSWGHWRLFCRAPTLILDFVLLVPSDTATVIPALGGWGRRTINYKYQTNLAYLSEILSLISECEL